MKIDVGIPMPEDYFFKGRGNRRSIYPFMEMNVGDSVFFPSEMGFSKHGVHKAYDYAKKIAKRSGDRHFRMRRVEGGIRIWRVE